MSVADTRSGEAVTAIIPTWGDPAPLARALASVAAQTLPCARIVVVDDASPAPERERLRALIAGHPLAERITLVERPQNGGAADARNAGWEVARTPLIAFLDADDAWHPEKLARQVPLMRGGAAMSCHGYAPDREMETTDTGLRQIGFRDFLWRNRCATPSVMVRRDAPARFPAGRRRSEDYHLWLWLSKRGPVPRLNAELARGFKPAWGAGGLSGDLDAMLRGQLDTYSAIVAEGLAPRAALPVLQAWSRLRHLGRRILRRGRG